MEDGIGGCNPLGGIGSEFAGIEVSIEAREVAAGDFEAQTMTCGKDVARGPEVDGEWNDPPGGEQSGRGLGVAIARAKDTFGEVDGRAIGEDVDQFGREVGVEGRFRFGETAAKLLKMIW